MAIAAKLSSDGSFRQPVSAFDRPHDASSVKRSGDKDCDPLPNKERWKSDDSTIPRSVVIGACLRGSDRLNRRISEVIRGQQASSPSRPDDLSLCPHNDLGLERSSPTTIQGQDTSTTNPQGDYSLDGQIVLESNPPVIEPVRGCGEMTPSGQVLKSPGREGNPNPGRQRDQAPRHRVAVAPGCPRFAPRARRLGRMVPEPPSPPLPRRLADPARENRRFEILSRDGSSRRFIALTIWG
jgi:hypothetical protein